MDNNPLSLETSDWGVELATHPQSSTESDELLEIYLYSPCGPSWLVLG